MSDFCLTKMKDSDFKKCSIQNAGVIWIILKHREQLQVKRALWDKFVNN